MELRIVPLSPDLADAFVTFFDNLEFSHDPAGQIISACTTTSKALGATGRSVLANKIVAMPETLSARAKIKAFLPFTVTGAAAGAIPMMPAALSDWQGK